MSGTYAVTVGDRGRLVIPAEVRQGIGWHEGTTLSLIVSSDGVVLLTREQLKQRVRRELSGLTLVDELLADRRAIAEAEDIE